jgi:tetratricopeptide (TPR) repeat protein
MGRMSSIRRRAFSSFGALVLVAVLGPDPALADYKDNFANAVIAIERGDMQEAIKLLNAAVKENPKESTERIKLYGMRYKEYVPYFFLGVAYSKSGNCTASIEAFTQSERQGVAQGLAKNTSEWGTIKDNLAQCITSSAKAPGASPRTPEVPIAQNPPPRPTETTVAIAQAPPTRPPAPTPEVVARAVPPPTVAPPTAAPPTRAPSPKPTTVPVPSEPLLAAANAYFRGDYAGALKALASVRSPDNRVIAQARLFRAAAGFGLFIMGGSKAKTMEDRAIQDVRECARLDPNIRVSTRAFSPRFVDFFDKNRT